MEFFIKHKSELPILKMQVVRDGRTDAYKIFDTDLDTATIRFSMKNESNGIQKILMNNAYITEKTQLNPDSPSEYYIYYRWSKRDTNTKGRFIGEFHIHNSMGELIAPIRENLYINII
jgi:hypothetical protein|tara:strand:- start:4214 stop:4567 length:354 start_codon:yes stop_codon:yes gene_type:complete